MNHRVGQVSLGLIVLFMLPVGVQAAFAPRSFFDDFPLGRNWISGGGDAYNEHLVRDVGALFLALIVVSAWALWRQRSLRPAAVAWLIQGLLHLSYHVRHLDGYEAIDKVGLVGSLAAVPVLALIVLWAGWAERPRPAPRD